MKKLIVLLMMLLPLLLLSACKEPDPVELTSVESGFDFIYEIVNNSSEEIVIANYIVKYTWNENKQDYDRKVIVTGSDVSITSNSSYQFKYKLESLKKDYGASCFIGITGGKSGKKRFNGFENDFENSNKKHTVILHDKNNEYSLDGSNEWETL